MAERERPFGLIAVFERPDALVEAARRTREAGYRAFDAHTPFPVEGLAEAIGFEERRLSWAAFAGGVIGAAFGLLLQWWVNVVAYPLNIGGRPLASWPAFVLPAFEMAVLFAVLFAVGGMLLMNRLPRLNYPLFELEDFSFASMNRFFLVIESRDPHFELRYTRRFLEELGPRAVLEVPS
jgi:hypothetical protein